MHTIHELDEGHWEQWLPLWKGYLEFYRAELPEETTRSTFARLVGGDRTMFGLLAVSERGEGVGLTHCIVHPTTWSDEPKCYLEDLFVAPAARGSNLGQDLLKEAKRESVRARRGTPVLAHPVVQRPGSLALRPGGPTNVIHRLRNVGPTPLRTHGATGRAWKDAGVPNLRTMVTELGTGLGMLGDDDLDEVLRARSPVHAEPVARRLGPSRFGTGRRGLLTPSFTPPGSTGAPSSPLVTG